jgi:UPF0176 protein
MEPDAFLIILFYAFTEIADPEGLRDQQRTLAQSLGLKGRLFIAREGINGTFEGTPEAIRAYEGAVHSDPRFSGMIFKESAGTGSAFRKLQVKVKDEVVTLEAGAFDIKKETAKEMSAAQLEALYEADEDFVILDLRNTYEIDAGYFEKTVHPGLTNFRELPEKLQGIAHLKDKKVIAVCTGGIRCEKATCLLQKEGFTDLYQLKDGIHTYMQQYPGKRFKGSLFVFDNRMVTPVIDTPEREVVGKCIFCGRKDETYYSDDSVRPSRKVICCDSCIAEHAELRNAVTH